MPRDTFFNLSPQKRALIEEVALDAFASQPFGEVSITQLVAACGIAKGSFYQYFDDKLDLFLHLLQQVQARKMAMMGGWPPRAGRLLETLARGCWAGVRLAQEDPRLLRLSLRMIEPQGAGELAAIYALSRRTALTALSALIELEQQAGRLDPDVSARVGAHLIIYTLGPTLLELLVDAAGVDSVAGMMAQPERLRQVDDDALEALVDQLMAMIQRALGAKE